MRSLGSVLVLAITLAVLVGAISSAALKTASNDLASQVNLARNASDVQPRTAFGQTLSGLLAADLVVDDLGGRSTRASLLDHRADRLLEATAVAALLGTFVWL